MLATTTAAQAEVRKFTATTALDGRTVKDPAVPVGRQRVADMYLKGQKVNVVCQDTGPDYGGRKIWDLTTEGLWILDGHTSNPAVYLGDNKILEASPPRDGRSIRVSELNSHGTPYSQVRRIIG